MPDGNGVAIRGVCGEQGRRDDLEADERRETRGARSSVRGGKGGGGGDPRRTRRVSFWRVGRAASDLTRPDLTRAAQWRARLGSK